MIYDYHCTQCKSDLSIERSIHEKSSPPTCFDCHIPMDRKFDIPGITFKGSGFYSNGG